MSQLPSGSISISNLIKKIGHYKGSPVRVAQATFDYFDDVMQNNIDLVDPTNPFVMLLETSAVHTALSVNESLLNLRRSYVGLAETDQDIYRHMTDAEFVGRFSVPGSAVFTFMLELNSLLNVMVQDTVENCLKAIIPRDTYITVDTYTFTLEYPIVIRQFPNGILQITYDTEIISPISRPSNSIINFKVRQDSNLKRWLYFTVPLKQMEMTTINYAVQRESVFNKAIGFKDQFVFARVFQKSGTNPNWVEMYTTHSDQVFDKNNPTAILQVLTNQLNVTIPFIYNTLGSVSGQIRIDLYTSKGNIDINLGSYSLDKFEIKMRNIDALRDDNIFNDIWANVNYVAFSDQILSGGIDGISFSKLREKVINYAFGNFNIPITTAQLDTVSELNGFKIVRNADTLTNRYLLGVRAIPDITVQDVTTSAKRLLNRANVGMIRFNSNIKMLESSDNVISNNGRLTLLSNTAFSLKNGQAFLVETSFINGIKAQQVNGMVSAVNASSYVYTPYYYVFDLQEAFLNVRPYDLDHPDAANLSFVKQNSTLMLLVNTASYSIAKIGTGYRVTIVTVSGSAYKQLNDNQVGVQLRFISQENSLVGTINGVQQGTDPESGERIYTFDIETSYDINEQHRIEVINCYNADELLQDFYVSLTSVIDILYTTTSFTINAVPDETDELINKDKLPSGSMGNSHDTIELFLGNYLEHLWARSRTYASGGNYELATASVPARYEQDVYEINPVTGSMLFINDDGEPYYNKIHEMGDLIRDENDQQIFKYRKGDTILDNAGNPIPILADAISSKNDFDIMVIDGNFLFVTDPNYINYRDQIVKIITGWITSDILEIQSRLIERTEIFFYPQASLGVTQITVNGSQTVYVNSEQVVNVTVFMDQSLINDHAVQTSISDSISNYLDDKISELKFTVNQLESELKALLGNSVYGVTISGLGGTADYKSINVSDQHNRLCIKRKLFANTDSSITIIPDINITFMRF